MMKRIPIAFILLRLIIGPLIIILSLQQVANYSLIAITLLAIGLLTDIFDGIIARRLNVSTQQLRRLDSTIDQIFFISVAIATYIQCQDFFKLNAIRLTILFSFEGFAYLICFIKFKKEIATHSIGAKIWTLFLFATLVEIMAHCKSLILFEWCFWIGLISRLEIIAIIIILKKWTNDVPTFYHSILLRSGKEIKRNKLFNG